jgi:hypothetical protein
MIPRREERHRQSDRRTGTVSNPSERTTRDEVIRLHRQGAESETNETWPGCSGAKKGAKAKLCRTDGPEYEKEKCSLAAQAWSSFGVKSGEIQGR